jgi:DNA-binding IclR family transcriptional regulator
VARAMSVLECFRSGDKTVGNHEIAKRCKLPKSTVSRLTHTLTRLNYLSYDEDDGRYSVGSAGLCARDEAAWPTLRARLERSMDEYQKSGTAVSFGEWQNDVNGIAVGIRVGNSRGPMTINCGGPAFTLSRKFLLEEVRPRLLGLLRRIETSLDQAAVTLERL